MFRNLALLKRQNYNFEKKKFFGGKIVSGKKVCVLELCLVFIKQYSKSFSGKNVFRCKKNIFSRQKSSISLVLTPNAVQICRKVFPLGNPPYAKKVKPI